MILRSCGPVISVCLGMFLKVSVCLYRLVCSEILVREMPPCPPPTRFAPGIKHLERVMEPTAHGVTQRWTNLPHQTVPPLILLPTNEPTDEASDRSTIPACSDPVTDSGEKTFDLHDSSVSSCVCPLRISALHDPRAKCRTCERREKACSRSWRRHGGRLRLLRDPRSDVAQSLPVNGKSPRSSRCCEEASLPPP